MRDGFVNPDWRGHTFSNKREAVVEATESTTSVYETTGARALQKNTHDDPWDSNIGKIITDTDWYFTFYFSMSSRTTYPVQRFEKPKVKMDVEDVCDFSMTGEQFFLI